MHALRRAFPRFRVNTPILPTATRFGTRTVIPISRSLRTSIPRLSSTPGSPLPNENPSALPPDATVSQRLKHLVKSYGWYALGVYLVFSALDFTVAFVGIHLLGAEQVSQAATYVRQTVSGFLHSKQLEPGRDETNNTDASNAGGHEGLYAMLVLAYTIHKTLFLPLRVGLTAAFTPRIVGWLRARGWAVTERAKQAAGERTRITQDHE